MNYLRFYLFFLISLPSILSAQKMIDAANLWYIRVPGDFTGHGRHTYALFFKDSIKVDNKFYYQAYTTTDSTFQKIDTTNSFYREDKGIVYRLNKTDNLEEILYNFNLKVGDSIIYQASSIKTIVKVLAIDTIYMFDQTIRKRLTVYEPRLYAYNNNNFHYWIEGIGGIVEPFRPFLMFIPDGGSRLSCFFRKESYIYGFNAQRCTAKIGYPPIDVNTKEIKPLQGLQLLQNLGDGNVSFRLENPGQYQCKIYDAQGKLLKTQPIQQGNNHCTVADFPKGVYFLNIYDFENNLQKTLKILHQ